MYMKEVILCLLYLPSTQKKNSFEVQFHAKVESARFLIPAVYIDTVRYYYFFEMKSNQKKNICGRGFVNAIIEKPFI